MKGAWVVGVRDTNGKLRLEVVADRGTVRLTRFIERYVRPGTWLHADYWKGYANGNGGTQDILGALGIRGLSVNHKETFKEWVPKHRKFAITNSIEGDWNAVIVKTPKRKYGYKDITPFLRQVEFDRENSGDLWKGWWDAFKLCTPERVAVFANDLKELYLTDPNLVKETHPLVSLYTRGFHGRTGNSIGTQSSKSKFHYAWCSTSNPNHYGCRKCDWYWGQYCIGKVDLIKEARKAAFADEKDKEEKKKMNDGVSRLSLVLKKLEVAVAAEKEERRLAFVNKVVGREAAKGNFGDEENNADDDEEEEEGVEGEGEEDEVAIDVLAAIDGEHG